MGVNANQPIGTPIMSITLIPAAIIATAIPPEMFGGNTLFHMDDINQQFTQDVAAFNLTNLRWPGGSITEQWFDPANPDVPLKTPRKAVSMDVSHSQVLTFTEIMKFSRDTGRPVDIVVPTIHVLKKNSRGIKILDDKAINDIEKFVTEALRPNGKYPKGIISSIEVGNEYWATMSAKDYGIIANALVPAIDRGIKASGSSYRPKILVQVGDIWGPDFEKGGEYFGSGMKYGEQLRVSNQDVVNNISGYSRKLIDGIIDHYYATNDDQSSLIKGDGWDLRTKKQVWTDAGIKSDIYATEWNVKSLTFRDTQHPATANAGALIETFENMTISGVKAAYVWPIHQSTSNDLAGVIDDNGGHLSVSGAAFKLLSNNVRGLSPVKLQNEDDVQVEKSVYQSTFTSVIFLTPKDNIDTTIDLTAVLPQEAGSGDFKITQQRIVRDSSQDTFVGNNAGAKIVDVTDTSSSYSAWPLKANAYEVTMVRVDWKQTSPSKKPTTSTKLYKGNDGNNSYTGTTAKDLIMSYAGDDYIKSGKGDDIVYGGSGNDTIIGEDGNDQLTGDAGKDKIYGSSGNDLIKGGYDDDALWGGDGDDRITGGYGADVITGEKGNDFLFGEGQNDQIDGGDGNDVIVGGFGNDNLTGSNGNDTFYFGSSSYGSGLTNVGGAGEDRVSGGSGNDTFTFGGTSGWTGISDFEDGKDKIRFVNGGIKSLKDLKMSEVKTSTGYKGVRIEYSDKFGGGVIRVESIKKNITPSQLTTADISFK